MNGGRPPNLCARLQMPTSDKGDAPPPLLSQRNSVAQTTGNGTSAGSNFPEMDLLRKERPVQGNGFWKFNEQIVVQI